MVGAAEVLVVDDEPDILASLTTFLRATRPHLNVLTARDVETALPLLGRNLAAILTDYRMPGLTGLDLLLQARRRCPGAARLLMTAFPDHNVAIAALNQARIRAFLVKPIDAPRLGQLLDEIVAERTAGMV